MSSIQFTSVQTDDGQQFLTIFANGTLQPPVDSTHPNFEKIRNVCLDSLDGEPVDVDYLVSLFDVAETVRKQFARLSDRVTVRDGVIMLDGDPVHGTLQDQILAFVDAGEDFAPLVNFYEKLLTNPLGDVREGLYSWITGQTAEGALTITPDGDLIGYKSMQSAAPEWRKDADEVFIPSRPSRDEDIVNGEIVPRGKFIEQAPGDVVEMPRSKVLNAPSQACGDGLHIGTWNYAKDFTGDTVMLVRFSPRDIVSLPDSASTWKLRVCRYTVIGPVTEPLDVPVYQVQEEPEVNLSVEVNVEGGEDQIGGFKVGDLVSDEDGREGEVTSLDHADDRWPIEVTMDDGLPNWFSPDEITLIEEQHVDLDVSLRDERGRFHRGRPGSQRDENGRFVG